MNKYYILNEALILFASLSFFDILSLSRYLSFVVSVIAEGYALAIKIVFVIYKYKFIL